MKKAERLPPLDTEQSARVAELLPLADRAAKRYERMQRLPKHVRQRNQTGDEMAASDIRGEAYLALCYAVMEWYSDPANAAVNIKAFAWKRLTRHLTDYLDTIQRIASHGDISEGVEGTGRNNPQPIDEAEQHDAPYDAAEILPPHLLEINFAGQAEGATAAGLAKQFGVSPRTMYRRLKEIREIIGKQCA